MPSVLLLRLQLIQVSAVDVELAALAPGHLSQDPGFLETSKRGVHGGHAELELRCRRGRREADTPSGELVDAQRRVRAPTEAVDLLAVGFDELANASGGGGRGARHCDHSLEEELEPGLPGSLGT